MTIFANVEKAISAKESQSEHEKDHALKAAENAPLPPGGTREKTKMLSGWEVKEEVPIPDDERQKVKDIQVRHAKESLEQTKKRRTRRTKLKEKLDDAKFKYRYVFPRGIWKSICRVSGLTRYEHLKNGQTGYDNLLFNRVRDNWSIFAAGSVIFLAFLFIQVASTEFSGSALWLSFATAFTVTLFRIITNGNYKHTQWWADGVWRWVLGIASAVGFIWAAGSMAPNLDFDYSQYSSDDRTGIVCLAYMICIVVAFLVFWIFNRVKGKLPKLVALLPDHMILKIIFPNGHDESEFRDSLVRLKFAAEDEAFMETLEGLAAKEYPIYSAVAPGCVKIDKKSLFDSLKKQEIAAFRAKYDPVVYTVDKEFPEFVIIVDQRGQFPNEKEALRLVKELEFGMMF